MAEITFSRLLEILKSHPDYRSQWEQGTAAETALYISFESDAPPPETLRSDDFETSSGDTVVLDRDSKGTVYGIEIG